MRYQELPLHEIEAPSPSDKLHPFQDEDEEDWDEFKQSVGQEPNKPLEVVENGDGFELVDGDRRLRALEENGATQTPVIILEPGEDIDHDSDKYLRMIVANEFRKNSDKEQRARKVAQLCAPWLLPSGERLDVEPMNQSEFAEQVGKSQGTISNWMVPIRNEQYPLRGVLSDSISASRPDDDKIELLDETVDILKRGTDGNSAVVSPGQTDFIADELSQMKMVSLREIKSAAEKASENGWTNFRFLEYIENNYAYSDTSEDVSDDVETGIMGEQKDFADSPEPTADGREDFQGPETVDGEEGEELDLEVPEIEVNWSEHVDDNELGGVTLSELEAQRMQSQRIEDEASVAINILSAKTGLSSREVMQKIIQPIIVDSTIGFLQD